MEHTERRRPESSSNRKPLIIALAVIAVIGLLWFLISRAQNGGQKSGVQNKNAQSAKKDNKIFLACDVIDLGTAEKLVGTQLKESASTLSSVNAGSTVTTGCTYVSEDKNVNDAVNASIQIIRYSDENAAKSAYANTKSQADKLREANDKKPADKKEEATSEEVKDVGSEGIYLVRNGQLNVISGRYVLKVSVKKGKEYNKDQAINMAKTTLDKL